MVAFQPLRVFDGFSYSDGSHDSKTNTHGSAPELNSIVAAEGAYLDQVALRGLLSASLESLVEGERVLVLIPDHTRTAPLPALFPMLVEALRRANHLDFMVALGTHPPLSQAALLRLIGITPERRAGAYRHVGLFNHAWDDPSALSTVGILSQERIREIAGEFWHPSLGGDVDVRLNRTCLEADRIIIVGPVFPHEVAGFSGGAKYLFPGVSGPEMIDVSHWLGALAGILRTVGVKDTPVRMMIEEAADLVRVPVTLAALVIHEGSVAGAFIGDREGAWSAAADLSRSLHITWLDRPLDRVVSWAPPMYDELWTAAKAMYKLEPALADGAELIVYAPHLDVVSRAHGEYIYGVGYHVLPYFLGAWRRFSEVPLAVLAHSTHVKGAGRMEQGIEKPRINVKLASKITAEDCERLNLGYVDPMSLDPDHLESGTVLIQKAGERLYRIRG